jgi:flavin reductase (DIM6/NTAB) family NADH-FMN oxidoreductase RutF
MPASRAVNGAPADRDLRPLTIGLGMDEFRFRDLCGRFATGVTIVTAFDAEDRPAGMTVNSFASVSLHPPLVSIAVDRAASAHAAIVRADRWTVNVLASHQEALSRRFAALDTERFDGVGWRRGPDRELLLDGVLAHLVCTRHDAIEAGDHTVVFGLVTGGSAAEHGRPLLYYRGGYADPDGV